MVAVSSKSGGLIFSSSAEAKAYARGEGGGTSGGQTYATAPEPIWVEGRWVQQDLAKKELNIPPEAVITETGGKGGDIKYVLSGQEYIMMPPEKYKITQEAQALEQAKSGRELRAKLGLATQASEEEVLKAQQRQQRVEIVKRESITQMTRPSGTYEQIEKRKYEELNRVKEIERQEKGLKAEFLKHNFPTKTTRTDLAPKFKYDENILFRRGEERILISRKTDEGFYELKEVVNKYEPELKITKRGKMEEVFHQLDVAKQGVEREALLQRGSLSAMLSITTGQGIGFIRGFGKATVGFVAQAVKEPKETAKGLISAVIHPIDTTGEILSPLKRGEIGEVGGTLWGMGKIGKLGAKATKPLTAPIMGKIPSEWLNKLPWKKSYEKEELRDLQLVENIQKESGKSVSKMELIMEIEKKTGARRKIEEVVKRPVPFKTKIIYTELIKKVPTGLIRIQKRVKEPIIRAGFTATGEIKIPTSKEPEFKPSIDLIIKKTEIKEPELESWGKLEPLKSDIKKPFKVKEPISVPEHTRKITMRTPQKVFELKTTIPKKPIKVGIKTKIMSTTDYEKYLIKKGCPLEKAKKSGGVLTGNEIIIRKIGSDKIIKEKVLHEQIQHIFQRRGVMDDVYTNPILLKSLDSVYKNYVKRRKLEGKKDPLKGELYKGITKEVKIREKMAYSFSGKPLKELREYTPKTKIGEYYKDSFYPPEHKLIKTGTRIKETTKFQKVKPYTRFKEHELMQKIVGAEPKYMGVKSAEDVAELSKAPTVKTTFMDLQILPKQKPVKAIKDLSKHPKDLFKPPSFVKKLEKWAVWRYKGKEGILGIAGYLEKGKTKTPILIDLTIPEARQKTLQLFGKEARAKTIVKQKVIPETRQKTLQLFKKVPEQKMMIKTGRKPIVSIRYVPKQSPLALGGISSVSAEQMAKYPLIEPEEYYKTKTPQGFKTLTIPKIFMGIGSKTKNIPTMISKLVPKVIPRVIPIIIPKLVPKVIPRVIPTVIPKVIPKVTLKIIPQLRTRITTRITPKITTPPPPIPFYHKKKSGEFKFKFKIPKKKTKGGKRGYTPTLWGIVTGKTLKKMPTGKELFSGMEIRLPIRLK